MKGDFSKWDRKDKLKSNFNGVLHQQGRVLLDSDWNEQTRINGQWQDTAGRDIIGTGVAAIPAEEPDGFKVTAANSNGEKVDITVKSGRAWIDGLPVHLNRENEVHRTATYLEPPLQTPQQSESTIGSDVRDAVVLEIWKEEINGFQMPEELIEPALGGPDTTERIHTAMAFRLFRLADGDTCSNIRDKLKDDFSKKGKLNVSLQPTAVIPGDCPVVEGGGYTGFEHNLYRIEIARIDGNVPMFKWSQFNGGLAGRGIFDALNNKVAITANLQAIVTSDLKEFYLEAVEYDPGPGYWKVTCGAKVTLNNQNEIEIAVPMFGTIPASTTPVFFRLWNDIRAITEFPKAVLPAEPKELRDGIRLEFEQPAEGSYVPGDYWTFSVRAGEVKNNQVLIDQEPPEGIHYHRAALAILNWDSDRAISFEEGKIDDCRDVFQPLTNRMLCCSFMVGDGKSSHGDFNSIEEALRHLPKSGGEICILPGLHEASVLIKEKKNIKIRGCGEKTRIIPSESNRGAPVFHVVDSQRIELENMDMVTLGGTAIVLEGTEPGALKEIEVCNNRILACIEAISVKRGVEINLHHNRIRMLDMEKSGVAIYIVAEDSVVERNDIGVVPPESIPPVSPPGGEVPPEPTDPCADSETIYKNTLYLAAYANLVWTVSVIFPLKNPFRALGGIQVAGGSERIKVLENRISGGAGNGITPGEAFVSVPPGPEEGEETEHVIENTRNAIQGQVMKEETGLKGITLLFTSDLTTITVTTGEGGFFVKEAEHRRYNVSVTTTGYRIASITTNVDEAHTINVVEEEVDTGEVPVFTYDIQIDRNDISNMGLSGIGITLPEQKPDIILLRRLDPLNGILAKFGYPVVNLSIHRNHIFNCFQNPFNTFVRDEVKKRGLGGISLGMCGNLSIRGNRIESNGVSHTHPVCGIYVAYGEHVDVAHNHVVNNGPLAADINANLEEGIRGGMVLTVSSLSILDLLAVDRDPKRPAARVHDNVVDQPAGQALRIISSGPVSVLDNQFNSELSRTEISDNIPLDMLAGAVLITDNIGSIYSREVRTDAISTGVFSRRAQFSLGLPNGNILFNSNQVRVGLANKSLTSLLIFSKDDIGFIGNQSDNFSDRTLLVNTLLLASTLRASNNRFKEAGEIKENQMLLSLSTISSLMNNTTNNQGDHCIRATNQNMSRLIDSGNLFLISGDQCGMLERHLQQYIKNNQQLLGAII